MSQARQMNTKQAIVDALLGKLGRLIFLLFLAAVLVSAELMALPFVQQGMPAWNAFWLVLSSGDYWWTVFFCGGIFITLDSIIRIIVLRLHHLPIHAIILPRGQIAQDANSRLDMTAQRIIVILLILGAISALAGIIININKPSFLLSKQFGIAVILLLFSVLYLIDVFLKDPSPKLESAIERIDVDRVRAEYDERFRQLWEKSAAATLYWALGLIFVLGSLYDILITRRWPVRSVGEVVLILVVWTVAYRYWEKRL